MSAVIHAFQRTDHRPGSLRTGIQAAEAIWLHATGARLAMQRDMFHSAGAELFALGMLEFSGVDEPMRSRIETFRDAQFWTLHKQWDAMAARLGKRIPPPPVFED